MNLARILASTVVVASAVLSAQTGTPWTTPTPAEVDAIYPDIEALYIDLHRNPELAFQETQTAAKLAARVKALGFDVTTGVGRTGIVAVMKNGPGPTVMLRTELDALPVCCAWVRQLPASDEGYIGDGILELAFGTVPSERGLGVGTATLARLIDECPSARALGISLSVRADNPAVRLYQRFGLVTLSEIVNRVGTRSLVMKLDLAKA